MRSARGVVYVMVALLLIGSVAEAATKRRPKKRSSAAAHEVFTVPKYDPAYPLDERERALAQAMSALWTRDAGRLVHVISRAASEASSDRLTLLLAIAHAETNGRVLLVSEAGAVGLAQATPIAYLAEGFNGPLFVTQDYLDGALAYFLKKPLGDVARIARFLADEVEGERQEEARRLLQRAWEYRREGVEDLALLARWGGDSWLPALDAVEIRNEDALKVLARAMEQGADAAEMRALGQAARETYLAELELQRICWKRYQDDLNARRDEILKRELGLSPSVALRSRAYEAGAILARELDERFSPETMARFLVAHVETKAKEARRIGSADDDLERVATALYNGGAHNLKRMRSGLIQSLPETERYADKVPATRARLDEALEKLASGSSPSAGR